MSSVIHDKGSPFKYQEIEEKGHMNELQNVYNIDIYNLTYIYFMIIFLSNQDFYMVEEHQVVCFFLVMIKVELNSILS